ncbi:MAG: serine/threonine-protein kinase [Thiobacillus sp.]|nr:serine/threonine-protein kinase [Thiobacillus sp.]
MTSQTIIGRYEVVATLGQGAMGTVYKAVDPLIERTVAIKTINLNLSKEERAEFEERFYREAKSAGRLNHSNIVTIYDVGETDDIAYIAMEYLDGESLREMLDSGVVLPVDMIGKIAARIAGALDYAHENHVVHRDIKPANIMITPGRDVKIMDFGIAQIPTGSRTQLGTVLGSPKYMAPEQVAGQATDGRTDIFALGVVLYEILTGTTPFNGDNLSAIMYKVLNEDPAPPSTVNPRVPPFFDRIVSRALAKRPQDRYQTAGEFARDLKIRDGAPPETERLPAVGGTPANPGKTGRTQAGPHDATVFLPPDKAREVMAAASAASGPGTGNKSALRNGLQRHKPALLALSLLAVAAFAVYVQGPSPAPGRMPAPVVPVFEGVGPSQTAVEPALPAAPATAPSKPAAAPAAAPSKPATVPAAVAQAKATVSFAISPWGEIFVDGKRVGVSPPFTSLQLEAGKHQVEVRNQGFAPYRDTVNLKPGQSLKIRHKFR